MKKTLIKGLLLGVLLTGGAVTTTKLYSQTGTGETTPTGWADVYVTKGYWYNGQFIVTGYGKCCGNGTAASCTPSNC